MYEIERRFLIKELPNLSNLSSDEIEQRYISHKHDIRIRKKDDKYYITSKSEGTIKRTEIETEINKTTYEILSSMTIGNIIKKTRYYIPINNNHMAELNIYHDNFEGLITIEIEFNSLEEAINFIPPSWFGQDITENDQYKNQNLANINNHNKNYSKILIK